MTAVIRRILDQFQTLSLIPKYFQAIAKEWTNILFGESILAVIFLVWWALGSPPLVLIFLLASLVAGYYAWRASQEKISQSRLNRNLGTFFAISITQGSQLLLEIQALSENSSELSAWIKRFGEWEQLVRSELFALNLPIDAALFSQAADNVADQISIFPDDLLREYNLQKMKAFQKALCNIAERARDLEGGQKLA